MSEETAKRIISDNKAVTVTGTAEKLVADVTGCYRVDISADVNNTKAIVIGGLGVVALAGDQKGTILFPGNNPIIIYTNDVSKIYVDAEVSGELACFTYYIA